MSSLSAVYCTSLEGLGVRFQNMLLSFILRPGCHHIQSFHHQPALYIVSVHQSCRISYTHVYHKLLDSSNQNMLLNLLPFQTFSSSLLSGTHSHPSQCS